MVFAKLFEYLFLYGMIVGIIFVILLEVFIFGIIYIIKNWRKHKMYEVILLNEKRRKI